MEKYVIIARYPDSPSANRAASLIVYDKKIRTKAEAAEAVVEAAKKAMEVHTPNLKGKSWFTRLFATNLPDEKVKITYFDDTKLHLGVLCKDGRYVIIEAVNLDNTAY